MLKLGVLIFLISTISVLTLFILTEPSLSIFNENQYLQVTYKSQIYKVKKGSTFKDLCLLEPELENSVLYTKNYILTNGETIIENNTNKQLISINTDNIEELIKIPGIGEKIALKIIEYRQTFGDFKSIDELLNISGIGENKFAKIKGLISI